MTDTSVFDAALRIAGLPLHGSRAEKTARLLAHQSKASPKAPSPPKKTIVKKQKKIKSKTSPSKMSQVDFFKKHRPAVMKAFKKEEDRQKELRRLWSEHNSPARSGASPSKPNSKPIIKDHELDQATCRREGIRKIGEKGSKHIYLPIDAAASTSKTESKKPVKTQAALQAAIDSNAVVAQTPAQLRQLADTIEQTGTAAGKKPVKAEKKNITLAVLKKVAGELSLASYGNKQKISQRIIAALKNDEDEDAGPEPIEIDDDDDDVVVKNEDEDDEDDEDEDEGGEEDEDDEDECDEEGDKEERDEEEGDEEDDEEDDDEDDEEDDEEEEEEEDEDEDEDDDDEEEE